ncbi:hypothetical protein AALA98_17230 [Lachnospiraceae bacterium 45-W7]
MERNKPKTLYYKNSSDDEKILIQWYRENPHSVYMEIALLKLLDWEIITKEKCREFQAETCKYVGSMQDGGIIQRKKIMDKDGLKNWLFEIFNEHDSLFFDVSLYDEADTLFVKSSDGQRFSITVNAITDNTTLLNFWAKKNPGLMPVALGILYLKNLDILTKTEYEKYISAVIERSDSSDIRDIREILENLGNDK